MTDNDQPLHIVNQAGLIYGVNEGQPILTLCGEEIRRTAKDFPVDRSRPHCDGCEAKAKAEDWHPKPTDIDPANFGNSRTYNFSASAVFRWPYFTEQGENDV